MTGPDTYGSQLLAQARAHGMTGEELATLLGIPVPKICKLTGPDALGHHPTATLRTIAERLDLPWPGWLATEPAWPDPPTPDTRHDPARVHAVLAAAIGQPLHLGEIAHVLDWTIDRVQVAAGLLASRTRTGGGTRLTVDGDTLTLNLAPRMLDTAARQRLAHLLHADGLGPDPHVLYMIYRLATPQRHDALNLIRGAPDLLEEAIEHQLVTYEHDEELGTATEVRLHPNVAYSLGITHNPSGRDHDPATEDS